MRLSLQNKFLIPMIALIVIGMGVSSTITYIKAHKALKKAIIGEVEQVTIITTQHRR